MTGINPVPAIVPEVKDAPAHVVDDVNDHTPEPVQPPVVEHLPDPPHPADGLAELRETVATMATALTTLTDHVMSQAKSDESPAHVPWTHRGGKVHHEHGDD